MEHTFTLTEQDGHTLLTSQEYPWCVLQVVPTTLDTYLHTYSQLLHRGYIAQHPVCRQFLIIHLACGNHDGQHPEREIKITQSNSLFARNAPTAACDPIPADARFTAVHAALTPSTAAPFPAWCASIAPLTRNLIYYCVAVTACGITPASREK